MIAFLVRRMLAMALTLLGVSIVVFGMLHAVPGDPAQIMLGPEADAHALQALRHELGLDQPVYVQYVRWLRNLMRGDLGTSIVLRRSVFGEVMQRFDHTLLLALAAIVVSFAGGITIGVISAIRRGSLFDRTAILFATGGLSLPSFWFALVLIVVFSLKLRWLPGTGMASAVNGGGVLDILRHLVLPAVALAVIPLAVIARYTRSAMLEVNNQDYVRTARAKGLPERVVTVHHAFKNTLVVLITMLGLQTGFLLAGAVYIENVFSWPGIGQMLVNGILTRDFPLVQGGVLIVATAYVVINVITDIAYVYFDPRVRLS
jgi:peptide/nickel transport system permease protein